LNMPRAASVGSVLPASSGSEQRVDKVRYETGRACLSGPVKASVAVEHDFHRHLEHDHQRHSATTSPGAAVPTIGLSRQDPRSGVGQRLAKLSAGAGADAELRTSPRPPCAVDP